MNLFNIPLVDHAEKFTSLESLNVNLDETVFVSIVRTLRQNSLKEIGVPESLNSFETIYPALLHHKDSLKVIFENEVYLKNNFLDWKYVSESSFNVDLNLDEFPKLEYVVRKKSILLVDRNGPVLQFVPVEYHPREEI